MRAVNGTLIMLLLVAASAGRAAGQIDCDVCLNDWENVKHWFDDEDGGPVYGPNVHSNLKSALCETASGGDSHQGICPPGLDVDEMHLATESVLQLAVLVVSRPTQVKINQQRRAVQIFDCEGNVVAHFLLRSDVYAAAETAARVLMSEQ